MKLPGILTLFSSYSFFDFSHRKKKKLSQNLLEIVCHPNNSIHRVRWVSLTSQILASWSFHYSSPKNIKPFPLHDLPGIPTLFSHNCFSFFFFIFSSPRNFEKGFACDSSDCSIRALPIFSWPLNTSLLSFVEHMALFSTHNWRWNRQCQL